MEVSVDNLKGLARRVSIVLAPDDVEAKVQDKLSELTHKVRLKGFRKNKVPLSVVQSRYGDSVHQDIAFEMVEKAFSTFLKDNELEPAGRPQVDERHIKAGEPVKFVISFEEYPQIQLANLNKISVEKITVNIDDADIDKQIDRLQKKHAQWTVVDRAATLGDGVLVDFDGTIKGVPFEGGKGKDVFITLGDGDMLPDFEKGLVGAIADKPVDVKLKFPKTYKKELAGKKARFHITVKEVKEATLPALDVEFIEKLGIEGGKVDELREKIRESLEFEFTRVNDRRLRGSVLDALMAKHKIELPQVMLDSEISRLKEEAAKAAQSKQEEAEGEVDDTESSEVVVPVDAKKEEAKIVEAAKQHVSELLLLRAFVMHYKIDCEEADLQAHVRSLGMPEDNIAPMLEYIRKTPEQLNRMKSEIVESKLIDKLLSEMRVTEKAMSWEEAMKA